MAYINKKDFSIMSCINSLFEDEYFECDEIIAPAISLLNKKGYETTFCCSGHPYAVIDSSLLSDPSLIISEDIDIILVEPSSKLITDTTNEDEKRNYSEYPYHAIYKTDYCDNFYISFKYIYDFSDLPKGIRFEKYDDNGCGLYENTFRKHTSTFDGILELINFNKKFYEWVDKLPSLI